MSFKNDISQNNDTDSCHISQKMRIEKKVIQCLAVIKNIRNFIKAQQNMSVSKKHLPYLIMLKNVGYDDKAENNMEFILISWKDLSNICHLSESVILDNKENVVDYINSLLYQSFNKEILKNIKKRAITTLSLEELLMIMMANK